MKKLFNLKWALIFALIFTYSCSNDDDASGPTTLDNEINDFVWEGMNYWYYYQDQVADLADSKNDNQNSYFNFLNSYSTPEDLFNALVFSKEDDFSWFIEDVEEQQNAFAGISESFGLNIKPKIIQADGDGLAVVFVSYVIPNSPAEQAGVKRGDLIYKVNGIELTIDEFSEANELLSPTSPNVSIGIGTVEGGSFVKGSSDINLTAVQLNENPVHFHSIIEENGKKIGYLVYNSFVGTYHSELNDVFANFKAEGINELILDLRYNGGGSVLTAALLASMIDGNRSTNTVFANLQYNSKRDEEEGFAYPFFDEVFLFDKSTFEYTGENIPMNRLTTLNRLYVIGSNSTASASEMIINGLLPFMPVRLIGETTTGKNEGSITVYDSGAPYTNSENRNPNHSFGMQPIVFQIFNSQNENDYDDGFDPDITIEEAAFAANILPFGDTNEVLLRVTLDDIAGMNAKGTQQFKGLKTFKTLSNLKPKKFSKEMYILPSDEQLAGGAN
ncbi:S41 family peptidase [Galbibacter mesophilus]|uniref:S41 family peptidase n=1 Tax=Galbibacter mesophilus TaxID=379069 RepID=UPI00191ED7B1|nr:S41 family peptidase [Galbibacter mesophilus]MCM5662863.1 S41 family peptidase [Galbibacter mesophilus]